MLKVKHIFIGLVIFLIFGKSLLAFYSVLLCYYLFCKGFMMYKFYPEFIKAVGMAKKYGDLVVRQKIKKIRKDNSFSQYLSKHAEFIESRLWFMHSTNKEEYKKMIEGSSRFGFLVFPIIIIQYRSLRKLNKHLKERFKE